MSLLSGIDVDNATEGRTLEKMCSRKKITWTAQPGRIGVIGVVR